MIKSERMKRAVTDLEIIQNEYMAYAAYAERNKANEETIKHFQVIAESLEIAVRCMKVMDGYDEV